MAGSESATIARRPVNCSVASKVRRSSTFIATLAMLDAGPDGCPSRSRMVSRTPSALMALVYASSSPSARSASSRSGPGSDASRRSAAARSNLTYPLIAERSSAIVAIARFHPPTGSPSSIWSGMKTSVRKTSLKCASPVAVLIGWISIPGVRMSRMK